MSAWMVWGAALLWSVSGHAAPLDKALKAYEQGDIEAASQWAERVLEKEPEHGQARWLLMQLEFEALSESGRLKDYRAFINKWRSGPLVQQAAIVAEFLEFEQIDEASPTSYRSYATRRGEGALAQVAKGREERMLWTSYDDLGSADLYRNYKKNFPDSPYAVAASARLAELAWVEVVRQNSGDAYLDYLREYPQSPMAHVAAQRSEDLAWARAMSEDSIDGWQAFREVFHDTDRARRAHDREVDLSWGGALQKHQISDYRDYELGYPYTDQALDAERREWDLYHFERELYDGEYKTSIARAHRQDDGTYTLWFDVLDRRGQLVGGLRENNFKVYDAGYRGEVLELLGMEHNRPVDVVFVVDMSGSMSDEIAGVKQGIARFASIMKLRSRDMRLGLVTFIEEVVEANGRRSTSYAPGGPLTADVPTFLRWVDRVDTNIPGADEHHFLAVDTASKLRLRKDAQRVFVLMSDEDVAYNSMYRREDVIRHMVEEEVMVYTVTPGFHNFKSLATETYGQWFELPRNGSFGPVMDALAQKISKQYKMTYRRPLEAPAVRGDLDVVVRIRTDHAWLERQSALGDALVFDMSDATVAYTLRSDGSLRCSNNGGATWSECGAGLPLGKRLISLVAGDGAWALAADGSLLHSDDGASTFYALDRLGTEVVSIHPMKGGVLAVTSAGQLVGVDKDGPSELVQVAEGQTIAWAAAHPTEPKVMYGLASGQLFRSDDGGQSFSELAWPHGSPPTQAAYHPKRRGLVYAWNPEGLSRSLDDGTSWHSLNTELPGVRQLLFDPTVRRMVLALTDHGVMGSDDLGRTWFDQNSGLKDPPRAGSVSPSGEIVLDLPSGTSGLVPVANREFVFSQLYYASGSVKPGRSLLPHLDELALALRRDRSLLLRIEGHADSDGSASMNQALSERRAEWVADYLEKKGVGRSRIVPDGYGEERPLFSNSSLSNKSRNRRVELVLVRPGELPTLAEGME